MIIVLDIDRRDLSLSCSFSSSSLLLRLLLALNSSQDFAPSSNSA